MFIVTTEPIVVPERMWGVFVNGDLQALFLYADQADRWAKEQWGSTTPGYTVKEVRP